MAAPSFRGASTGFTDATGAWAFTNDFVVNVGNVVILQVLQDGTTAGAVALTMSGFSYENLAGTDNALTQIPGPSTGGAWPIGASNQAFQYLYIGRKISGTNDTFNGTNSTSEDVYVRLYAFDIVSTGATLAEVIENGTAGNANNGAATSTTCSDTAVTTLGPDRLALNFVGLSDDLMGLAAFAGETGGNWDLIAVYEESSGTDATIGLQISPIASLASGLGGLASISVQGSGGTTEESSCQFTTGGALTVAYVSVLAAKTGSPTDNLVAEIQTDSGGLPSGTVVGSSGSIACTSLTTTSFLPYRIAVAASLSAATTYHVVFRRDGARDTSNHPLVESVSTTAFGGYQTRNSGTWTDTAANDLGFALLTSTDIAGGTIDGGSDTITSISWGVVGFALIGTTVVSSATSLLLPNPRSRITRRYPTR